MEFKTFKAKYGVLIAGIGFVLYTLGIWLWGYHCGKQSASKPDADTSVVKTETITASKVAEPIASQTRQVGTITLPVKVQLKEPDEVDIPNNTILIFAPNELVSDSADLGTEKSDTALKSSLRAVVPLTQKEYRDSNFTAYVSGFMPKLDSIEIRSKITTITKTVTKYHAFNVGITGGLGYGVINRKPDVFVGVGVTVNLWPNK